MTGVRWREDVGFEGRCEQCREWWPITGEHWNAARHGGWKRCKACQHDGNLAIQRRLYAKNRRSPAFLAYQKQWYRDHSVRLCAQARARTQRYHDIEAGLIRVPLAEYRRVCEQLERRREQNRAYRRRIYVPRERAA